MLRINLLPSYVAQRRMNARLLVVFVSLFVVIVAGLLGYNFVLAQQIAPLQAQADQADALKAQIANLQSEATAATSSLGTIQANLQFVKDVHTYNLAYIQLYRTVAQYTSPAILYKSMSVSGTTLSISAYTPSIAALGRYLMEMYQEPDATSVGVSAIPGYGSADPDVPDIQALPANVNGRLPGYPGAVHSITVYRGRIIAVNSGGTTTGASGPNSGIINALNGPQASIQRPFNARKDGFPITVTLTLKAALAPPAPPTAPAAGAASGPPGGMPPGMPGGPGGPGGPGAPGAPPA